MKLCRFRVGNGEPSVGVFEGEQIVQLTGIRNLSTLLEEADVDGTVRKLAAGGAPKFSAATVQILPPVDRQEVWAVGVTYLRSKKARMEESDFSATAYDRVYDAPRPELFFKGVPEKAVGHGDAVGIRRDATWNVPEPELTLVFSPKGALVGFTI